MDSVDLNDEELLLFFFWRYSKISNPQAHTKEDLQASTAVRPQQHVANHGSVAFLVHAILPNIEVRLHQMKSSLI